MFNDVIMDKNLMVNYHSQELLTIIFVNYNSTDVLNRALATLAQCQLNKEVVVVDNGSNDRERLVALCKQNHARLVLLKRNRGYGGAANQGFHYARGRYIVVANPDIEFLQMALNLLLSFLHAHPDVGVASPQLLYPDGKHQPSCRRLPKLRYLFAGRRSFLLRLFPGYPLAKEFLYLDAWNKEEPVEVEAVIGTMMVFRREAFEAVKGFDEGYFMFAEDLDICQRLRKKGWRVFLEPRAKVLHHYGSVRRRFRRFTEFQRIKGLHRFFTNNKGKLLMCLLTIGFVGYYFLLEASLLLGLGEFEYSWQQKRYKGN